MLPKLIKRVWSESEESSNMSKRIGRGLSVVHWNTPVSQKWVMAWLTFLIFWLVASAQDVVSPTLSPAPHLYPDLRNGVYPDLRKGAWFVAIWDIDGDNEVDSEIEGTKALDYIISTLTEANVDWVAIKLGEGTAFWPEDSQKMVNWVKNQGCKSFDEVVQKFNDNGIRVLGWTYTYGDDLQSEANVANKILDIKGIYGLIIDAETEYKGKYQQAIEYMETIRKKHKESFIAYTSFPFFGLHSDFSYKEFAYYCNAFMPQCYWKERPSSPEIEMEKWQIHLNVQYLKWWQSLENEKEDLIIKPRDAVKPVIPVGMSYDIDNIDRKTTPEEIKKFCNIAWGYGYPLSIYRAEIYWQKGLEAMGPKGSGKWQEYGKSPDVVAKALQFLRTRQQADGSWLKNVGITALSLLCFLNAGCGPGDPTVIRGIQYLLENAKEDGSITNSNNVVYETSLALLALIARQRIIPIWVKAANKYKLELKDKDYEKIQVVIDKARKFLEEVQRDEGEGILETGQDNSWQYGGFGYEKSGGRSRPDLSNTQFAVMALVAAYSHLKLPMPELNDKSGWRYKAIRFVSRCQNRAATNDLPWAKDPQQPSYNDGGFIYLPGASYAGGTKSYGSMTAAGIWCLRLCGVSENDERVSAALEWLKNNEDLAFDDNPGLGTARFFYYYLMTFAKAMAMLSKEVISGWNWYEALYQVLKRKQDEKEGYWKNPPELKDWEDNPELATAFAILALQTPTIAENAWMTLILHSSADLHLYDPKGRHIGKNYETGELENEIPDATFDIDPEGKQIITLRSLESGIYRIELFGTETGDYLLSINGYADDSLITSKKFQKTIRKGQTQVGKFTVVTVAGPLTIYAEPPLPVPSGLVAKAGDRFVDLIWESYTEPGFELVGYNVYRSESKGGVYRKINSEPIRQTWFRDTDVVNGVTYYYTITAIDRTGNETERSRYVKATPSTAAPPLITILIAPNPVGNDGGIFFYNLPSGTREARIVIFDITGRPLIEIPLDVNGRRYPATGRWNPVDKNGIPLANGPYIYVLIVDGKVIGQGKMVIQR